MNKKLLIKALALTSLIFSATVSITNAAASKYYTRNNCDVAVDEYLNNTPNTASSCYGVSSISGNFHSKTDRDWVNHYPLKSGTQYIRITTKGRMTANLYRGASLIHRGSTPSSGGVIWLRTPVNIKDRSQNILGVLMNGERGVTYTVKFYEVF